MTRDEATAIITARHTKLSFNGLDSEAIREIVECDLDVYVALGLLKLDEPETLGMRIEGALLGQQITSTKLDHFGAVIGRADTDHIVRCLDRAGLKIVEKG